MAETFTSKSTKDQIGFVLEDITGMITGAMSEAKAKLQTIKSAGSSVSIGNMFDMQLLMNRLAQFSEMSSAVISASHQSVQSMSRNIK